MYVRERERERNIFTHIYESQSTGFEMCVQKSTLPIYRTSSHMNRSKMSVCSVESYDDLKIPVTPKKEAKESDISNKIGSAFSTNTDTLADADGNK